jgi:hypothetical protein
MNLKNKLLFIFSVLVIHCIVAQKNSHKNDDLILISLEKQFVAGRKIILEFEGKRTNKYQIYISNSFGSTLVASKLTNNRFSFEIPKYLSNKTGVLNWSVIGTKQLIFGQLKIIPKEKPNALETYIGPPSFEAGGSDYTMLIVIPSDDLDNPLKQNTKVSIQQQFLKSEKNEPIFTKNLIGFKYIYSPLKTGRILLSSETLGLNSKEYDVNIMPAIATSFTIYAKRNHEYADGNQITSFSTSVIKDKNKNIISDGNYVYFFIKNKTGNILKTSGTTISGVATAKIIHPDFDDEWTVKAYIIGMAESNTLEIKYKKVVEDFEVVFMKSNRKLLVGPVKSFMNQLIPDGLQIKLSIYKNKKLLNEIIKRSRDGGVFFELNSSIYKNGDYELEVSTAKVSKMFQSTKLW